MEPCSLSLFAALELHAGAHRYDHDMSNMMEFRVSHARDGMRKGGGKRKGGRRE